MPSKFRTSLVLALALGAASAALAQDQPPVAAPSELLQRMESAYPVALRRPKLDLAAADRAKAASELAKAETQWDRAVETLARTGDEYLGALAGAAPDARALYYRGFGKVQRATRVGSAESGPLFEAAADSLLRYLDGTDDKAAFRADAELHAGHALVGSKKANEAIDHFRRAVDLLQKEGRHDDAGDAATSGMQTLKVLRRDAELREFADAIHASEADFGASTPVVRTLAAGSRFAVGSPLPKLPEVKDVDGKPVSWAPGKPMVLHFFLTGFSNGTASSFREIDTEIRPLWERYKDKDLRFVGVSMDYEIPAKQADEMRKRQDEDGVKREFRDGSLASVRKWAGTRGVEWPWVWDGRWTGNELSQALGGVGVRTPYAVLVDKDGIVRWRGEAPFKGLAEETAKLLP